MPQKERKQQELVISQMRCPYCKKIIGVEENRFQCSTVSFIEETGKIRKTRVEKQVLVIYCQSCGSVLGVTC
ncbi:MAG TPA: hypothetical protein EYP29_02980 [Thermoplasmata archaeon]|nr:hypothetical protein [Thermoplasmata archaeon]